MPGAEKFLHSTSSLTMEESAILLISANQCSARVANAKGLISQKTVHLTQTVMQHVTVSDLTNGRGCTSAPRCEHLTSSVQKLMSVCLLNTAPMRLTQMFNWRNL